MYKIYKPVRLIEMFAGIGSQAKSLKNLNVPFEHYFVCDNNQNAINSYNAIHGTNFKKTDITKLTADDLNIVDLDKYTYIFVYTFPCQDLSVSGKQRGMEKGSNTRSSLLWEVERILTECVEKPQVLLMENVTQVHNKKNIEAFETYKDSLVEMGYTNYCFDLNAKEYGVPQSRKRCFMVSLHNTDKKFHVPEKIDLKRNVKEYFEPCVDDTYYVEQDKASLLIADLIVRNKINNVGIIDDTVGFDGQPRLYENYSPTLRSERYGLKCIEIQEDNPVVVAMRGRYVNDKTEQRLEPRGSEFSNCITTVPKDTMLIEPVTIYDDYNSNVRNDQETIGTLTTNIGNKALRNAIKLIVGYRLRTLTPKECWRLMGFDDSDFEKASKVCKKTQLYKQAGNSIVVNCLTAILGQLFVGKEDVYKTHTPDFLAVHDALLKVA